jgi:hypothetical protein
MTEPQDYTNAAKLDILDLLSREKPGAEYREARKLGMSIFVERGVLAPEGCIFDYAMDTQMGVDTFKKWCTE